MKKIAFYLMAAAMVLTTAGCEKINDLIEGKTTNDQWDEARHPPLQCHGIARLRSQDATASKAGECDETVLT